jgi:hypothetical protein
MLFSKERIVMHLTLGFDLITNGGLYRMDRGLKTRVSQSDASLSFHPLCVTRHLQNDGHFESLSGRCYANTFGPEFYQVEGK